MITLLLQYTPVVMEFKREFHITCLFWDVQLRTERYLIWASTLYWFVWCHPHQLLLTDLAIVRKSSKLYTCLSGAFAIDNASFWYSMLFLFVAIYKRDMWLITRRCLWQIYRKVSSSMEAMYYVLSTVPLYSRRHHYGILSQLHDVIMLCQQHFYGCHDWLITPFYELPRTRALAGSCLSHAILSMSIVAWNPM